MNTKEQEAAAAESKARRAAASIPGQIQELRARLDAAQFGQQLPDVEIIRGSLRTFGDRLAAIESQLADVQAAQIRLGNRLQTLEASNQGAGS